MKSLVLLCCVTWHLVQAQHGSLPDFCYKGELKEGQTISCAAYILRWKFDAEQNDCVQFVYGGCGASRNNFVSREQCLEECSPHAEQKPESPVVQTTDDEWGKIRPLKFRDPAQPRGQESCPNCNWLIWGHYDALNCYPNPTLGGCCPKSFTCPAQPQPNPEKKECIFQGQRYQVGERIPSVTEKYPCKASCFCQENYDGQSGGFAQIVCANVECPENFAPQQEHRECFHIYEKGKCCSTGQRCGTFTDDDYICQYDGKRYVEGQRIYVTNEKYEEECICDGQFRGPGSPSCKKVECGFDVNYQDELQRGCVPVYLSTSRSCPIDWLCPDSSGRPGPIPQGSESVNRRLEFGTADRQVPEEAPPLSREETCRLPKERGRCRGRLIRFYFDTATGDCASFYYSGCGGNENNFETLEDCQNMCPSLRPRIIEESRSTKESVCDLPPVQGPCRGRKQRFYWDPSESKCKTFDYGGCRGNANNFRSETQCLEKCHPQLSQVSTFEISTAEEVCQMPMDKGPCKGREPRWYYNADAGVCEPFVYGGCGGNGNQFKTNEDCLQRCSSTRFRRSIEGNLCHQPKETGSCNKYALKYFFNYSTNECEMFWYGGCDGNGNRFETLEECRSVCLNSSPVPFNTGNLNPFERRLSNTDLDRNDRRGKEDRRSREDRENPEHRGHWENRHHRGRESRRESVELRPVPYPAESADHCTFGSHSLQLWQSWISDDEPCFDCNCQTPPMLTCLKKECPRLPPNCKYVGREPGSCCPKYECP